MKGSADSEERFAKCQQLAECQVKTRHLWDTYGETTNLSNLFDFYLAARNVLTATQKHRENGH